ncbi:hypothetical protein [Catenulispora pinisilvae]|uniref:hypothetical protein n=1 Tax=Catenulispora pinisilvae TaxID=2705253 RepID=UPI001891E1A9|nr:hypothetical protein [Catenulispora pinisilvae]
MAGEERIRLAGAEAERVGGLSIIHTRSRAGRIGGLASSIGSNRARSQAGRLSINRTRSQAGKIGAIRASRPESI